MHIRLEPKGTYLSYQTAAQQLEIFSLLSQQR